MAPGTAVSGKCYSVSAIGSFNPGGSPFVIMRGNAPSGKRKPFPDEPSGQQSVRTSLVPHPAHEPLPRDGTKHGEAIGSSRDDPKRACERPFAPLVQTIRVSGLRSRVRHMKPRSPALLSWYEARKGNPILKGKFWWFIARLHLSGIHGRLTFCQCAKGFLPEEMETGIRNGRKNGDCQPRCHIHLHRRESC
jgi:hypothetical protein